MTRIEFQDWNQNRDQSALTNVVKKPCICQSEHIFTEDSRLKRTEIEDNNDRKELAECFGLIHGLDLVHSKIVFLTISFSTGICCD